MKHLFTTIIEEAIRKHEHQIQLFLASENDVNDAIKQTMRANPDIFWFSYEWNYSKTDSILHLDYTFDSEHSEKITSQINDVIEQDFKIAFVRSLSAAKQIMYVYKWIALYCNYNVHSAHNQTIYSVFIHRNSVCTGIAKAAQYLLGLLGIDSKPVFGRMNNSPESSRHCWLVVKLEGEWYHLDPTFAIPETADILSASGVQTIEGADYLFYNYFCVDTATIKQSRTIEDEESLPTCVSTFDYNEHQTLDVTPSRNGKNGGLGCLLSDSGTTADIYLTHDKDIHYRHHSIAKVFRDDDDHELFRKELVVMRECTGSHILHATAADFNNGVLYIGQATPLSELLSSHYFKMTIQDLCLLLIDIASGLKELLNCGILYRDIHLNNIYLSGTQIDGRYIYKLGDFGSCIFTNDNERHVCLTKKGGIGSQWYMAPETWNEGIFDERSAVYGIGMIAYFLLNDLYPPLWNLYRGGCWLKRCEGTAVPKIELYFINNKYAEERINLILLRLLAFSPKDRIQTLNEVITNIQYFKKVIGSQDVIIPHSTNQLSLEEYGKTRFCEQSNFTNDTKEEKYISASVECPNCGSSYDVFILQDVVNRMLPSLSSDKAQGNYNLAISSISQFIYCPHCGYQTTPEECADSNRLSLSTYKDPNPSEYWNTGTNTRHHIDDFATTLYPYHKFAYNKHATKTCQSFSPKTENSSSYSNLFRRFKNTVPNILSKQKVNSSIFAPVEAKKGDVMMVQVFLYKNGEEHAVACKAAEVDPEAERKNYTPLSVKLKKGDKVKVFMQVSNKNVPVEESVQELTWQGHFIDCQFAVYVSEQFSASMLLGTVVLSVNGAPAGRMMFKTNVVDNPRKLYTKIDCQSYHKIFISYSHKDESRVKYLAEAYKAQGVDYFFDRHYLKAGDVYPIKIQQYIDSADLFILCWSKNAAESEYVTLECNQAMSHAYPQVSIDKASITIHPISIEPRAAYPENMDSVYNFEEI